MTTCSISVSLEHAAVGIGAEGTDGVPVEPPPHPCKVRAASSAAVAPMPSLSRSRRLSLCMLCLDAANESEVGARITCSLVMRGSRNQVHQTKFTKQGARAVKWLLTLSRQTI